ncbi:Alkanal monooxygenase beta chain [Dietzia timorensis]|uniref:Alkanal monooxygenase beta chain n=2 Tax=Dietzia timorensis TaxID=499555 RepID=A0A173LQG1_9ACTN|nr:Alkanal monooxygenase beta chain [Dietzia timorensis]
MVSDGVEPASARAELMQQSPFEPSVRSHTELPGWRRVFAQGSMTLGLFFPIESYRGDTPRMEHQVERAQAAERAGFAGLYVRDILLRDPDFGDVGQIFDPWTYLAFIAGQTSEIAIGSGSIVAPFYHPLILAKQAASIDRLSGGRFIMGAASGDRQREFAAFGQQVQDRGAIFRETIEVMRHAHATSFRPTGWSGGALMGGDVVPKPLAAEIPLLITGTSQQAFDWIARNGHGWLTYPRALREQKFKVAQWREAVRRHAGEDVFKPFAQSLPVDLLDDPGAPATPMKFGFSLGRNKLLELLGSLSSIGVNHVILGLKAGRRPASDVLEELAEHVVPRFPALQV